MCRLSASRSSLQRLQSPFCPPLFDSSFFYCSILRLHIIPKQSCPTQILDCASSICASISCDCWSRSSCSVLYYHSTMPYFPIRRRISMTLIPHLALCRLSRPWLSTKSRRQISDKEAAFIFFQIVLAALAVLIQCPFHGSSSFLLNLNKRHMTFVSQPLILSKTALLQHQLSLTKQSTP